jgi:hypothetical protein
MRNLTMSATVLYRVSAVILLLFAAGHTLGFLTFKPPSAEGLAVREAMNSVPLQVGGQTFTYGGFYRGFGLFVSTYLLFCAYLAWHLGTNGWHDPRSDWGIALGLCRSSDSRPRAQLDLLLSCGCPIFGRGRS